MKKTRLLLASSCGELGKTVESALGSYRKWLISFVGIDLQGLIACIQREKPDILLIVSPSDTAEFLSLVHGIVAQASSLPILAVAVDNDSRLALRLIEAGARGYLLAECVSDQLVPAVEAVLAGRVYLSPGIAGVKRAPNGPSTRSNSEPLCPPSPETSRSLFLKDKEEP